MSSTGGGWRDEAAYQFVETIRSKQVPFEFLRRNERYGADYAAAAKAGSDPPPALPRWGLRFRD